MTYTDDPSTDIGKVRVLIPDRVVAASAHFDDETLQAYLDIEGDIRMAAASALDAWATEVALDAHDVTLGDYRENTRGRAEAMAKRAEALRKTASETPAFAVASPAVDGLLGFQGRDRLLNAAVTGELG